MKNSIGKLIAVAMILAMVLTVKVAMESMVSHTVILQAIQK